MEKSSSDNSLTNSLPWSVINMDGHPYLHITYDYIQGK